MGYFYNVLSITRVFTHGDVLAYVSNIIESTIISQICSYVMTRIIRMKEKFPISDLNINPAYNSGKYYAYLSR